MLRYFGYSRYGKRALDIVTATIALVILSPALLALACVVWMQFGRPILFCQVRPGRSGKPFTLYKFRTMHVATNATGSPLSDAERLTPFGSWLRSTSLDELPELWNVLLGNMSLVGPRPLLLEYLDRYTPQQKRRHEVRPGLTGLAQVSGRNGLSWEEKFSFDLKYVDSVCFLGDLRILWLTVIKVFCREGIAAHAHATAPEFLGTPPARHTSETLTLNGRTAIHRISVERWPVYDAEQLAAVTDVLRSGNVNYWTGQECKHFEEEFADFLGVRHAVAVANGTVALELSLYALGIVPGDEVIVPSRTFIATASAVVACGATPIVADIDPLSQNLTRTTVEAVLSAKTRAIIAVHLGGWPCEMDELTNLAAHRNLHIIEDCAQAHGAVYRGKAVGSLGSISAFSFCQDKILSTGGEGGLVATNDSELWERVWARKDHGKNRLLASSPTPGGAFRYVHDSFGTNARLTEMQAAIGRKQLAQLPTWVDTRNYNAAFLMSALADLEAVTFHRCPPHSRNAYYRLYGFVNEKQLADGWTRDSLLAALTARGVMAGCGSGAEIYREKAFRSQGRKPDYPTARHLHGTSLAFCVHPNLSQLSLESTADIVRAVFINAMTTPYRRFLAA